MGALREEATEQPLLFCLARCNRRLALPDAPLHLLVAPLSLQGIPHGFGELEIVVIWWLLSAYRARKRQGLAADVGDFVLELQ